MDLTDNETNNTILQGKARQGKASIAGTMQGFRQTNMVYNPCGISPTLLARDYKDPVKVVRKYGY